ncbi:MAG: hypothetical protein PHF33_02130 [Candidatus Delongbacteria bacterium]|nr:hypothetical protein [Candidatus Delongbacteria bacterium]
MKQPPELTKAENSMKPGVITKDGFLGTDNRHLIDILTEDDAEVARLGLTHWIIAARMRYFRDEGLKGEGLSVEIEGKFEVLAESAKGKLACPFGEPGMITKNNISVTNKETGRTIYFSDLDIHLIGRHGFYQGKGSPYRVSPKELKEVLEIESSDS